MTHPSCQKDLHFGTGIVYALLRPALQRVGHAEVDAVRCMDLHRMKQRTLRQECQRASKTVVHSVCRKTVSWNPSLLPPPQRTETTPMVGCLEGSKRRGCIHWSTQSILIAPSTLPTTRQCWLGSTLQTDRKGRRTQRGSAFPI